MRNFSSISTMPFVSFNVNHHEYVQDVNPMGPLFALAKAFQTDARVVQDAYMALLAGDESNAVFGKICNSEVSVLLDFVSFVNSVQKMGSILENGHSITFTYCNLNTGVSVTWLHMVS